MKIYTKTGDNGETGLYGGERVPKDAPRVRAYGSVDELNAALGMVRAQLGDSDLDSQLGSIQNALFDVGADLATPASSSYRKNISPIDEADVTHLETLIDRFDAELSPLQNFILPGGDPAAAAAHLARTVARRAERDVISLAAQEEVNTHLRTYLNRLSDLLFVFARLINMRQGVSETRWHVKGRERMI